MNKEEIIKKVKELNLPEGSYVVFGSCPLAALGIRESGDVDMLATREVYDKLQSEGWEQIDKGRKDKPVAKGDFEVHYSWEFSDYNPSLEDLLKDPIVIDDVPFASLEHVRKWKVASGRPKDLEDIKLIDAYLSNNVK